MTLRRHGGARTSSPEQVVHDPHIPSARGEVITSLRSTTQFARIIFAAIVSCGKSCDNTISSAHGAIPVVYSDKAIHTQLIGWSCRVSRAACVSESANICSWTSESYCVRESAGACHIVLLPMTRAAAQRTPSSWAAICNLVSQNESRAGHKQASKLPNPRTVLMESSAPTAALEIHPTQANLKFTWSRPDLASGVVACCPHVLIERTCVARGAASGTQTRAVSARLASRPYNCICHCI